MESALYGTESAGGAITCPKCGHAQEERQECLKCGIIFSKYYALFPSGKTDPANTSDDGISQDPIEQEQRAIISDLQRQVREIDSRFSEVEFEKVERNRLRADLKSLEQQLQMKMDQMAERLERWESQLSEGSTSTAQQEVDSQLLSLLERLKRLEESLESADDLGRRINDLEEKKNTILQQLNTLQEQHSSFREEVAEIKSKLEQICEAQEAAEPRTPLEDDVHAIRKYLDEFRQIMLKCAT